MKIDINNLQKLPSNVSAIHICVTEDGETEIRSPAYTKFFKLKRPYKITGTTAHWMNPSYPLLTNKELSKVLNDISEKIESHGYIPLIRAYSEPQAYDYQEIKGHKTVVSKPTRKTAVRKTKRA